MSAYIHPSDVKSPRAHFTLITVLSEGTVGITDDASHAMAIGEWEGVRHICTRWNGDENGSPGMPQSRGIAIWFIQPLAYTLALISTLPADKQTLAKALMGV